ncbi:uncharacterized protein LOC132299588 [Cornus florida]|uniref:uncharacterized protein LOC132299588 n=1 Tax=Cornus florida TaxID=4283 RepID=UPI002899D31E|nr:uncharacterized protein LOC132299588 [Cornus florida]
MESFQGFGFGDVSKAMRKKRSNAFRRPRNESQPLPDYRDNSSLSSTPPSDNVSKASSDDDIGHGTHSRRKEQSLNQCSSRASSTYLAEAEMDLKSNNKDGRFRESSETHIKGNSEQKHGGIDSKMCVEGVRSPANWKSTSKVAENLKLESKTKDTQTSGRMSGGYSSNQSGVASDVLGNDNKLKKVKLKVGGVTRTIHPTSTSDGTSVGGTSSTKSYRSSDAPRPRPKLILQDSDEDHSPSPDKGSGLRGVPWKDFSKSGFSVKKMDSLKRRMSEDSVSTKQSNSNEAVRKSKRVPKRRSLGGGFDDEDDDEEIRYLEKLRTSKLTANGAYDDEEDMGSRKQRKISRVLNKTVDGGYNVDAGDYGLSRSSKEGRRARSGRTYEDNDYEEEDEPQSDGELETKRKNQKKEFVDVSGDPKREVSVTTRQRALQTGKDISSRSGASLIEYPDGLPPAPPRKQKEKLSEVEQQLKKVEAAQRRRMQMEKAARESEAEAIRKILGQDSSRKKREDKIKKRQEEIAQERAANAMTLPSNTVRWTMGPAGTVVTFANELGLPSIFNPKPCSYPPPREKCAGPSCTNPYKYRDSKSKLPLCSLQCYKAIHEKMQPVTTC